MNSFLHLWHDESSFHQKRLQYFVEMGFNANLMFIRWNDANCDYGPF